MLVKELKELLSHANDNDTITLYDTYLGERIYPSLDDIDTNVRDTFEINFDSSVYTTDDGASI